jgi:hypothetical protein
LSVRRVAVLELLDDRVHKLLVEFFVALFSNSESHVSAISGRLSELSFYHAGAKSFLAFKQRVEINCTLFDLANSTLSLAQNFKCLRSLRWCHFQTGEVCFWVRLLHLLVVFIKHIVKVLIIGFG